MKLIYPVLAALIGYLLGSFNTSLVVSRLYKTDVRKLGSGNAGMTNTLRTLGKTAALLVILGDVLKGILSCYLGGTIMDASGLSFRGVNANLGTLLGGLFAVIGHNWPVFFRFRGGKGALTSITVIFYIDWKTGLIVTALFIIVVALTRYVSLGSITGAAALAAVSVISGKDALVIVFSVLLAMLVILRHKSNIKRLLAGNESKLGEKKSKGDE